MNFIVTAFKLLTTVTMIITVNTMASEKFLPSALIQLDDYFSHHVIVAEKSTHKLHLYQNDNGLPKFIKTYQMATGKKAGDKQFQGDFRTPEGVFRFVNFLTHQDLVKRHGKQGEIYGVGAFVMNYPNPMDYRKKKTGGGIWLHSTNDETRIEKGLDSRGCLVAHNTDLIEISKYIELNRTNVLVTHELNFQKESTWKASKKELKSTIESWLNSWQNEDLKSYVSHYHKEQFFDKYRGNYSQFRTYKKAVFNNAGTPLVEIKNLSLLMANDYAVANFIQVYESKTIKDVGRKTLYLKRDGYYKWKIVSENWTKAGVNQKTAEKDEVIAFQPTMRFFDTLDPSKILGNDANITERKN